MENREALCPLTGWKERTVLLGSRKARGAPFSLDLSISLYTQVGPSVQSY